MKLEIEKFNCAGCSACANICPKNAISMLENKDGFYTPHIDENKCTDCGLCKNKCPQLNAISKNSLQPECYAVWAEDVIRFNSSSGGAFTVMAEAILDKKGIVCGAAFDENWTVRHIIIDNENDLHKLRGSKYVQSFISETLFKEIKKHLQNSRWVLFTGTPCQVAGLKSYLNKEYQTLILIDLVCSKVPPKKVFDKFLKDNNYNKPDIKSIKFRDKSNGWNCSTIYTTTTTTTTTTRGWFKMFLSSLSMNESCVDCKYMSINRVGDITIGDFWHIGKVRPDLDDNKGTSLILVNNSKGKIFFKELNWKKIASMTTQNAIDGNRALLVPFIPHQNRKLFSNKLETTNFDELVNASLTTKFNVGILNWWWNSNRGAILTCYAIQELVKDLGYNPSVIQAIPHFYYNTDYKNSISEDFAKKHLNLTEWCHSRIDMRKLNEKFETFMVGSDQIWNHDLNWFLQDFYYLNFAELNKKKIACAASFGKEIFTGNKTVTKMVEYYLKRFNAISVREKEAIDLLKNTFNTDGDFILDPVFLISKNKYEELASESLKNEQEKYIACYFIHNDAQKQNILKEIAGNLKLKIVNIIEPNIKVEDWLYYIKNAELVISDSFHASCFSSIFNTKFLTIVRNDDQRNPRFKTLSSIIGLSERFVKPIDYNINILPNILKNEDWEKVENSLKEHKTNSINWIKKALTEDTKKEYSKEQEYLEAFYASMDDRLNYLEGEIINIKENFKNNSFDRKKAKQKYKYYRIMSNLTFGSLKRRFLDKKYKYKNMVQK